jgi:hypothetical protein
MALGYLQCVIFSLSGLGVVLVCGDKGADMMIEQIRRVI